MSFAPVIGIEPTMINNIISLEMITIKHHHQVSLGTEIAGEPYTVVIRLRYMIIEKGN